MDVTHLPLQPVGISRTGALACRALHQVQYLTQHGHSINIVDHYNSSKGALNKEY